MKNKTEYTPGPWTYHLGRGANPRFHVQTTAGYQIASTTELVRHSQAYEENAAREANARLIAAAPELLDTLKAKGIHMAYCDGSGETCDVCRVIRKAEGH